MPEFGKSFLKELNKRGMKMILIKFKCADFLKKKYAKTPKIGLIFGSGLGVLADEIENPVKIPYR